MKDNKSFFLSLIKINTNTQIPLIIEKIKLTKVESNIYKNVKNKQQIMLIIINVILFFIL